MAWLAMIKAVYPNAKPGPEVTAHYTELLEQQYGADRNLTLMADSLCSDEICRKSVQFGDVFVGDGPFTLGGLAGMPFAGKTGMTAFAHHIPDDGTAFIFYGSHIGVDDAGNLGKVPRRRQAKVGSSCGALVLALSRLQSDGDEPYIPIGDELDAQQMMLERLIMPYKQRILTADIPIKAIIDVAYKLIQQRMQEIVKATLGEFHCARIALLGGIVINTAPDKDDYIDVRDFEVIELGDHH